MTINDLALGPEEIERKEKLGFFSRKKNSEGFPQEKIIWGGLGVNVWEMDRWKQLYLSVQFLTNLNKV